MDILGFIFGLFDRIVQIISNVFISPNKKLEDHIIEFPVICSKHEYCLRNPYEWPHKITEDYKMFASEFKQYAIVLRNYCNKCQKSFLKKYNVENIMLASVIIEYIADLVMQEERGRDNALSRMWKIDDALFCISKLLNLDDIKTLYSGYDDEYYENAIKRIKENIGWNKK